MRTYLVEITPLGPEGERLEDTVLTVPEADLFSWNFGRGYTDFLIWNIVLLPDGTPADA